MYMYIENHVILYTSDINKQDSFIQDAKNRGYDVVVFDNVIDSHYINHLEQKLEKTQIKRVDADILDKLIDKGEKKSDSALSVFESGAILQYLAQKTGKFYSEKNNIEPQNFKYFWIYFK